MRSISPLTILAKLWLKQKGDAYVDIKVMMYSVCVNVCLQVFVERYRLHRNWLGAHCHVRTFEGHTEGVSCVQFDDHRIVSGSHDNTIKVSC